MNTIASPPRAVDENGEVKRLSDDSADQTVSDIYLRNEFPPPGKIKAKRLGDTPIDRYHNALNAFGATLIEVDQAFADLTSVHGDDGQPVVDVQGVEPRHTENWRKLLSRLDEEMVVWGRTFRKAYGTKAHAPTLIRDDEDDERSDVDPYADADVDDEVVEE